MTTSMALTMSTTTPTILPTVGVDYISNSTFDATQNQLLLNYYMQIFRTCIFSFIFVFGTVGNLLVITVYAMNRQMHDTTNTLIINLAISDLSFIWITVPYTAYQWHTYYAFGGLHTCQFISYFQYVSAMCSVWTLVIMAFDRFLAVVYPFVAIQVCLAVWVMSVLINMPMLPEHTILEYSLVFNFENHTRKICLERDIVPTIAESSRAYLFARKTAFCIVVFVLPLSITIVLYASMVRRLWRNPFRRYGDVTMKGRGKGMRRESSHETSNARAKKRITIMVLSVTVVYAVCWFPMVHKNFQQALRYRGPFVEPPNISQTVIATTQAAFQQLFTNATEATAKPIQPIAVFDFWSVVEEAKHALLQLMCYTNSCLNPFLYAVLSENFRKGVANISLMVRGKTPQHRIRRLTRPVLDDIPRDLFSSNRSKRASDANTLIAAEAVDGSNSAIKRRAASLHTRESCQALLTSNGREPHTHTALPGAPRLEEKKSESREDSEELSLPRAYRSTNRAGSKSKEVSFVDDPEGLSEKDDTKETTVTAEERREAMTTELKSGVDCVCETVWV